MPKKKAPVAWEGFRKFLDDAFRIGKMPLSLWFAWGLFAYAVVPLLSSSARCFPGNCPLGLLTFQSTYFFGNNYGLIEGTTDSVSILLAFVLSVYGGWRGVRKYGASIKTVFAAGILGGVLMGLFFLGGTMVLASLLVGYFDLVVLFTAIVLLSLFLAVFASIGAFAAKEVE